jgi:hypothetical protein
MGEGDFLIRNSGMQEKNLLSVPAFLLSSFNLSFPFDMDRDYRIKPSN